MTEPASTNDTLKSLRDEYLSNAKQLDVGGLLTEDVIALVERQEEILTLAGKLMILG